MKSALRFTILGVVAILAALALTGCASHHEDFIYLSEDLSTPGVVPSHSIAVPGQRPAELDHRVRVRAAVGADIAAGFHDVYLGRTGSQAATKLNTDSADYNGAILSRDGTMVAFTAWDTNGYSQVFVASVDDFNNPTQLTSGTEADYYLPTWSADGATIATSAVNGIVEFALIDVATMEITTVTPVGFDGAFSPNITPDNQHLVFAGLAFEDGNPAIWMTDIDGTNPVKLTNLDDTTFDYAPSLSEDGMTIAFVRSTEGDDIFSVPIEGESESVPATQLTDYGDINWGHVYLSRDIAFASSHDAALEEMPGRHIYSMYEDGTHTLRLTEGLRFDFFAFVD
jgi:hypothetical protein